MSKFGLLSFALSCFLAQQTLCLNTPNQSPEKEKVVNWDTTPLKYYTVDKLLDKLKSEAYTKTTLHEIIKEIYESIPGNPVKQENANVTKEGKLVELSDKDIDQIIKELTQRYSALSSHNMGNGIDKTCNLDIKEILKEGISNALFSVRGKGNPLYDQVAKFVGRVNVNSKETGTGLIVSWNDMPESLKGRVILTCAHNCYLAGYINGNMHGMEKDFKGVKVIKQIDIGNGKKADLRLEKVQDNRMSFMLDLSDDVNDIKTFAPGKILMNDDNNHKSEDVEIVCTFGAEKYTADIALLILKNPITTEKIAYHIDFDMLAQSPSYCNLSKGEYFTIGYGMNDLGAGIDPYVEYDERIKKAGYFDKYIGGWNTKKKTGTTTFLNAIKVANHAFVALTKLLPERQISDNEERWSTRLKNLYTVPQTAALL